MNMKKVAVAVAIISGMAISAANAADDMGHGKVTFTGSIVSAPCSISPESVDQTVDLGQVSDVALKDGGTSTPKFFDIKLEQCDATTLKTVAVTFTGAASAANKDLLGINGSASGASVAVTDGSGQLVKLGTASPAQTIGNGSNTLEFGAYLMGDGADVTVVPGSFQTVADFTLEYK